MDRAERAKRAKKTKPPDDRRGTNPASLRNLSQIQPGEVRNPRGINGVQPYSDAMRPLAPLPTPDSLRSLLNRRMELLAGH